jgi:hypothetical protein
MRGAIHPVPEYAFMASCLVKHRDNFTFNIGMNLGDIGWEYVYWMNLAQYRDQWWAVVNTVVNLRVP